MDEDAAGSSGKGKKGRGKGKTKSKKAAGAVGTGPDEAPAAGAEELPSKPQKTVDQRAKTAPSLII